MPAAQDIAAALDAMTADQLREFVRHMLPWLEPRAHTRLVGDLVERATRGGSGWQPAGPTSEEVAAIIDFAERARRDGDADPAAVDECLRHGVNAFLSRDYETAQEIFRVLLVPIAKAEIYLGQHEMVDEVLGVDIAECAARYVVSIYMTTAPTLRANTVLEAIEGLREIGHFWIPLRELERVTVEPMPEFEEFLFRWRTILEARASAEPAETRVWESNEDRWLREAVERLEGMDGLGRLARSSSRAENLRAWCDALIDAGDWEAALAACAEAADRITGPRLEPGEFLDGAALAAQELGRKDLPKRLEEAWRAAPNMLRLRRWLGSAKRKATLRKRAQDALESCPKEDARQRAFLCLVLGDHVAAGKLLADAPGLGWSYVDHPGHLVFPLLCLMLSDDGADALPDSAPTILLGMDADELEWCTDDQDGPKLATPQIDEILLMSGATALIAPAARKAVCSAMRKAAKKRVVGVTKKQRRRHYGHAASLVAACVRIDATPACRRWATRIRKDYSRYPALGRELDQHMRA